MSASTSQITDNSTVCSIACSGINSDINPLMRIGFPSQRTRVEWLHATGEGHGAGVLAGSHVSYVGISLETDVALNDISWGIYCYMLRISHSLKFIPYTISIISDELAFSANVHLFFIYFIFITIPGEERVLHLQSDMIGRTKRIYIRFLSTMLF